MQIYTRAGARRDNYIHLYCIQVIDHELHTALVPMASAATLDMRQWPHQKSIYQQTTQLEPMGGCATLMASVCIWMVPPSCMPWRCGRTLWDVTCPYTFAPSHVGLAFGESSLVAAQAEQQKSSKYTELLVRHHFSPIAPETSGVFDLEAAVFFKGIHWDKATWCS